MCILCYTLLNKFIGVRMKKINYAIKIGRNETAIYKAGSGVVLSDKSVVVTGVKGKKEIAIYVGEDAINSGIEYRRVFEGGKIDFTLAKLMLQEYLRRCEIGKRDGIVFLVSMDDMDFINEYKDLAYSLGIDTVEVIPSVLATAFGFEIEKFRKSFLIVDIGINTEIAVINNGRILTGATIYSGGLNIDRKIAKYILEEKSIELSNETAEKVKNEIATLLPNDIRSISVDGFIKDTTEYSTVEITSSDILPLVVDEYNSIAMGITQLLSTCENEVNQDIRKHGIYLCGASAKMTGLEKLLKCKLNLNSYIFKPESVTMIGAGQLLDDPVALHRIVLENV